MQYKQELLSQVILSYYSCNNNKSCNIKHATHKHLVNLKMK